MKQGAGRFRFFVLITGLVALVPALVCVPPAAADNLYASIRGTVTDPSGAAFAGATVTAVNTDTGIQTRVISSQTGSYVFPQLAIGNYRITVSAGGFKTFQASGIHLDLDQVYSLNVKLELGTVSEQLIVEANPVQV